MSEQAATPRPAYEFKQWTFAALREHMGDDFETMPSVHWAEAALDHDRLPMKVDFEKYLAIEAAGKLRIFVVWCGTTVVGYAAYLIDTHLHYQETVFAISDTFYLAPEHRSIFTAIGLFQFIESVLKKEAVVMYTTTEVAIPGSAKVLERLGHRAAEVSYIKFLEPD